MRILKLLTGVILLFPLAIIGAVVSIFNRFHGVVIMVLPIMLISDSEFDNM